MARKKKADLHRAVVPVGAWFPVGGECFRVEAGSRIFAGGFWNSDGDWSLFKNESLCLGACSGQFMIVTKRMVRVNGYGIVAVSGIVDCGIVNCNIVNYNSVNCNSVDAKEPYRHSKTEFDMVLLIIVRGQPDFWPEMVLLWKWRFPESGTFLKGESDASFEAFTCRFYSPGVNGVASSPFFHISTREQGASRSSCLIASVTARLPVNPFLLFLLRLLFLPLCDRPTG